VFPGLVLKHFYVKFGDPIAASVFEILCEKNRHTQRQTEVKTYPPQVPSAWVINSQRNKGNCILGHAAYLETEPYFTWNRLPDEGAANEVRSPGSAEEPWDE